MDVCLKALQRSGNVLLRGNLLHHFQPSVCISTSVARSARDAGKGVKRPVFQENIQTHKTKVYNEIVLSRTLAKSQSLIARTKSVPAVNKSK